MHGEGNKDFYTRPLERAINANDKTKQKPPSGISTLGYAGCPHWVITQYCLGLPKVYCDIDDNIPFRLVDKAPNAGANVVEVHPALALWCWLDGKYIGDWHYKGARKKDGQVEPQATLAVLVDLLHDETCRLAEKFRMSEEIKEQIKKDKGGDYLDAYVAWLLGELWTNSKNENDVMFVGDKDIGAILLPNTKWSQNLSDRLRKQ